MLTTSQPRDENQRELRPGREARSLDDDHGAAVAAGDASLPPGLPAHAAPTAWRGRGRLQVETGADAVPREERDLAPAVGADRDRRRGAPYGVSTSTSTASSK